MKMIINEVKAQLKRADDVLNAKMKVLEKYNKEGAIIDTDGYIGEDKSILAQSGDSTSSSAALAMLQEVKARKLKAKGTEYDPIIFDSKEEIKNFLLLIANLVYEIPAVDRKFDIICQLEGNKHATPFTFRIQNNQLLWGVMDGSIDQSNYKLVTALLATLLPINRRVHTGFIVGRWFNDSLKIQNDSSSCAMYSTIHLAQMSRLNNQKLKMSFNFFSANSPRCNDDSQLLAPFYIRDSQSMNTIRNYQDYQPGAYAGLNSKESLDAYIKKYTRGVPEYDQFGKVFLKPQNRALDFKKLKYYQAALELLDTISAEEFEEIIANRINKQPKIEGHNRSEAELIQLKKRYPTDFITDYLLSRCPTNIKHFVEENLVVGAFALSLVVLTTAIISPAYITTAILIAVPIMLSAAHALIEVGSSYLPATVTRWVDCVKGNALDARVALYQ